MASEVSCAPWQDLLLGSATTSSATYDECSPDTVLISTNAVTASGATSDNQEIVYQELCGNGQLTVKVSGLTGGYAGLFVRESNAAGARKGAIMTQLGASVQRQIRSITNSFQTAANITASGHQWLRITRTSTHVYSYWSTNGTTWNLAFFTPLAMTDCVVIGMAAYSTSSGTTINATFTNISVTQSDTIPATEVAFVDSTLEAQGGDTVEICVNLENPCYCSPVTVDVALVTDSLPHLIGFEPQTLTFEEGDTVQCFTVVLEESDSSGTYTFELTNLEGGNDSEIGAIGELVLEVEGNEEEVLPGICGSYTRSSASVVDSTEMSFYDRFGNLYLLEELLIPSGGGGCGCDEFEGDIPYQDENYFVLFFEDCVALGDPEGFADPTFGTARRRAACRAFAELAHLIQRSEDPCQEGVFPVVNIRVLAQGAFPAGVLASASPYYDYRIFPTPVGGIIDGLPWKIINNGGYIVPENIQVFTGGNFVGYNGFHGSFGVNFENFGFYTGDAIPPDDNNNFYDLYHTVLHEALHILGFASLIMPDDGDYKLPFTKSYGRFDTHLRLSTGSSVIVRDATDPYLWELNISPGDLHKSCRDADPLGAVTGPDMRILTLAESNYPIYTGPPGTSAGSAFSHLNNYCDGADDEFLMHFDIPVETRIEIGIAEKSILCQLGYRVLDMEDCSCTVAGGNDFTQTCSENPIKLDLCEGDVFILPYSLLLGNDTGADGIDYLITTSTVAEVEDLENGTIRLTSCGAHNLSGGVNMSLIYTPVSSTCPYEGNPIRVEIEIHPCVGCENFMSDTPLPENNNPCNLICNPDIIAYTNQGEIIENNITSIICSPCHEIPGWYPATATPDYWVSPNVSGVSGSIGFISEENVGAESVFTPLSIEEGSYFFSFYGGATTNFGTQPSEMFTLTARLTSPEITSQFKICNPANIELENDLDLLEGEILVIGEHSVSFSSPIAFSRGAFCFEVPDNNPYDALWFYPATETEYRSYSYIDNIEVIPDNFDLGEGFVIPIGCTADFGGAFCMLSDVTIHYEWFEEVDNALVSIMAYNVLNGVATADDPEDPDNDDFDFDTQILTVAPNQTTTYVLQRSLVTPNDLPAGFELCTTEDEIEITVEGEEPEFTLVSEQCGLATFSITGLEPGDEWVIDFGDGIPASPFLSHFYLASGNYTATLIITRACDIIEEEVEVEAELCFECEDCNSGNTIGETGENTLLSDVITSLSLHPYFDEVNLCVEGTLVINTNYNFSNSTFLMQPGARILILEEKALSLGNSLLIGCDKMWRGIELEKNADIKMSGCTVLDAQYALYMHPSENVLEVTGGTVVGNTFGNNFVGLLVPPTPTGVVNVGLGDNFYYQSGVNLKPTYPSQMSLSPLPNQGAHALAGIIVNNQAGFGSYRNRFTGLTAGIVANRTLLAVDDNKFTGIRPYGNEYPNFAGRGIGIRADVNGSVTMAIGNTFSDCFVGISSNFTKLTATGNNLTDVDWGILGSQISTATITIDDNTIENVKGSGIWVVHANPGGSVLIGNNTVNTDADANGVGIILWSNNAPSTLQDNNITVKGTGNGIGMTSTSRATLLNNIVTLENADEARAGILLEHTSQSTFRNNSVSGFSTTGDANENIALEIASSSGNAYCCNTLNNTRLGVSVFGGSLTTDQFRGTAFGAHTTSLFLPNANAVLGTQTHTENCWQGNSGAAVYGVPFAFAQDYPFLVYEDANLCFKPTSHSPQGWFEDDENLSGPPDICATTICKTDGFKPDSDDVKRITDGDTTLLQAVRWELQRYIYEKLLTEAPGDTTNEKFRDNVENTTIGFFQTINESIAAMFAADSLSRAALNANLILASGKLDSLMLIDSLVTIEEDSSEIAELMQTRGGLTEVLFDLASDNETLTEEISDNFSDAADDIRAVNDTITVAEDFEINEKVVNDLYLAYLAEADTSEMDTLEAIAAQCPLLGGNAVYRARALLAMMTGELISYNDSLNCTGSQSFSRPDLLTQAAIQTQALQVFPNPATGEVKVTWRQAILQSGSLILYDLYGRKILELILNEGETSRTVALPNLPNNIYVLRLRLDRQDFARKISIKH